MVKLSKHIRKSFQMIQNGDLTMTKPLPAPNKLVPWLGSHTSSWSRRNAPSGLLGACRYSIKKRTRMWKKGVTHSDTPRRERMKWDEMKTCYAMLSCCHVMSPFLWNTKWRWTPATWPCSLTLENAWHDMINGKPVLGLAGSHTESRYRLMRPWTLPPHLP